MPQRHRCLPHDHRTFIATDGEHTELHHDQPLADVDARRETFAKGPVVNDPTKAATVERDHGVKAPCFWNSAITTIGT